MITSLSNKSFGFKIPEYIWLIAIWMAVTTYNLFKPYHIDDTAHLEIARWIGSHPLHPMSGNLNWNGIDEPIWRTNQPHLFFYALAIWGRLFGFGEPAMHILQSFFSLACTLLFYRIARMLAPSSAIWATSMLVLGPAFIVEQNLMVDVPLLAVWLAFFNIMLCGIEDKNQNTRYFLAGLTCSIALLIKYSSLILIPFLLISLIIERRRSQIWAILIPVATLAIWSLFNYIDYGGVHIATRPQTEGHHSIIHIFQFSLAWLVGLGALTPLGILSATQIHSRVRKRGQIIYYIIAFAFFVYILAIYVGLLNDRISDKILWILFIANSIIMIIPIMQEFFIISRSIFTEKNIYRDYIKSIYILLWIFGTTAFYVVLSPFIAARHVLLILPAILLIITIKWRGALTKSSMIFGLCITVVVSAGLCISDWQFAAFYRSEAVALERSLPNKGTIWTNGHWGWQWYAQLAGFKEVDIKASRVRAGDLLVVPEQVNHQPLSQPVALSLIRTDYEANSVLNVFCTGRDVRFYEYSYRQGPWSLSRNCLNRVDVFEVEPKRNSISK